MKKETKKALAKRLRLIAQVFTLMGPRAQYYVFTAAILGASTAIVLIAESSSRAVIFHIKKIPLRKRRRKAPKARRTTDPSR